MIKPKYDPRLDRLAARLDLDKEWPEGWSYRARMAHSFGPGHLLIEFWDVDFTDYPDEIEIKQTAWGVRIALRRESDDKLVYLLRIPFHLIIARLEVYARTGTVPETFDEFAEFVGIRQKETAYAH